MVKFETIIPWAIISAFWFISIYVIGPHEPLVVTLADAAIKYLIIGVGAWQVGSYLYNKRKNEPKRNLHTPA